MNTVPILQKAKNRRETLVAALVEPGERPDPQTQDAEWVAEMRHGFFLSGGDDFEAHMSQAT